VDAEISDLLESKSELERMLGNLEFSYTTMNINKHLRRTGIHKGINIARINRPYNERRKMMTNVRNYNSRVMKNLQKRKSQRKDGLAEDPMYNAEAYIQQLLGTTLPQSEKDEIKSLATIRKSSKGQTPAHTPANLKYTRQHQTTSAISTTRATGIESIVTHVPLAQHRSASAAALQQPMHTKEEEEGDDDITELEPTKVRSEEYSVSVTIPEEEEDDEENEARKINSENVREQEEFDQVNHSALVLTVPMSHHTPVTPSIIATANTTPSHRYPEERESGPVHPEEASPHYEYPDDRTSSIQREQDEQEEKALDSLSQTLLLSSPQQAASEQQLPSM
jgi:hypothetical protein